MFDGIRSIVEADAHIAYALLDMPPTVGLTVSPDR
jgi:hypothetical protein